MMNLFNLNVATFDKKMSIENKSLKETALWLTMKEYF